MFFFSPKISLVLAISVVFCFPLIAGAAEPPACAGSYGKISVGIIQAKVKSLFTRTEALATEEPSAPELPWLRSLVSRAHTEPNPETLNEIEIANKGLEARSNFKKYIVMAMSFPGHTAKLAWDQKGYIALTMGLQISAEGLSRRKDSDGWNPVLMGERLYYDWDFIRDFAFMTNETFWMSGLSSESGKSHSWAAIKKSVRLCALLGFADSVTMNLLIKKEADPLRISIDTAWEMAIGNGQTLFDLSALALLESLAMKVGGARLKPVGIAAGYVVAGADQFLGYYGFSLVDQWYEARKLEKEGKTEIKTEDIKLIPIYGPEPEKK